MRTKYRLYYRITTLGYSNIWYDPKAKKWFDRSTTEPKGDYYSSFQRVLKFCRALNIQDDIYNKFGKEYPNGQVILTRYYKKNGERWCQEFILPKDAI